MTGQIGEQVVKKFFLSNGYEVFDATKEKAYQDIDVDFVITNPATGAKRLIEVKSDYKIWRTGNIFAEWTTNVEARKDGWLKKCKADYIYYYDVKSKKLLIFKLSDLKNYINLKKGFLKFKQFEDYDDYGNFLKTINGYLVPISQLDFIKEISLEEV